MSRRLIPVEAAGDHPHPSGVIQRMDDKAFSAILAQPIPPEGLLLDFDHYSDLTNAEREAVEALGIQLPSQAAGWIKKFVRKVEGGLDRLFAEVDLTEEGETAIRNKSYLKTSPVHPRAFLEYLGDGIVRPLAISKVALTNEPNIAAIGAILNRRAAFDLANASAPDGLVGPAMPFEEAAKGKGRKSAVRNRQPKETNMEQIAAVLGCEPTEEAVLAAIKPLKELADVANRAKSEEAEAARKAELDALKNRAEKAEGALAAIKAQAEADAITAKVNAELAKYPDLPNRAEAEGILRKDFELGAKFLAGLPKPAPAAVPGKVPEDLNNREAADKGRLFYTGK